MEVSVFYKDVKVITGWPQTSGDPTGTLLLRPQDDDNHLQFRIRTVKDAVLGNNCPSFIPDNLLMKDRCTFGLFVNNLIERAPLDVTVHLSFAGGDGKSKTLILDARVFEGYWDQVCAQLVH